MQMHPRIAPKWHNNTLLLCIEPRVDRMFLRSLIPWLSFSLSCASSGNLCYIHKSIGAPLLTPVSVLSPLYTHIQDRQCVTSLSREYYLSPNFELKNVAKILGRKDTLVLKRPEIGCGIIPLWSGLLCRYAFGYDLNRNSWAQIRTLLNLSQYWSSTFLVLIPLYSRPMSALANCESKLIWTHLGT